MYIIVLIKCLSEDVWNQRREIKFCKEEWVKILLVNWFFFFLNFRRVVIDKIKVQIKNI